MHIKNNGIKTLTFKILPKWNKSYKSRQGEKGTDRKMEKADSKNAGESN